MELYEAIKGRRSVRSYRKSRVPRSVLPRVLEVARWAPSAHNSQPWRFVVVEETGAKRALAEAMAETWLKDLKADGVPEEEAGFRHRRGVPHCVGIGYTARGLCFDLPRRFERYAHKG